MEQQQIFKVTKKIQILNVKPSGDGLRYSIMSTDGDWFSTFNQSTGKELVGLSEGDVVEIEYVVNKKGFSNFSSIKLVENGELPPEEPPEEEREEKPRPAQRRGIDRIDKNCISAMQGALKLMEQLDLGKLSEEGIVEKFKALWVLIKEEIEK